MATEKKIKNKYQKLHGDLSEVYYKRHELTKEEFDLQHGKVWNDLESELISEGYLKPPVPPRDLTAEIDELKIEVKKLKAR